MASRHNLLVTLGFRAKEVTGEGLSHLTRALSDSVSRAREGGKREKIVLNKNPEDYFEELSATVIFL